MSSSMSGRARAGQCPLNQLLRRTSMRAPLSGYWCSKSVPAAIHDVCIGGAVQWGIPKCARICKVLSSQVRSARQKAGYLHTLQMSRDLNWTRPPLTLLGARMSILLASAPMCGIRTSNWCTRPSSPADQKHSGVDASTATP
jgi:hypothetical protein